MEINQKIILEIEETVKEEIDMYFSELKPILSRKIAMEIYRMILINHDGKLKP